jgi:hypothetical protein
MNEANPKERASEAKKGNQEDMGNQEAKPIV